MSCYPPLSAALIREILPVIKFEDLVTGDGGCCDLPESCAVCLYEFEGEDEIRNSFVHDETQEEFNQRLWAANNDARGSVAVPANIACKGKDLRLGKIVRTWESLQGQSSSSTDATMIPDQTSSMSPIIHAQAKLAFKSAVDSAGFMFQRKQQLLVSFLQRKMFYKITIPKFQKLTLTMKQSISE
ncbi:hypothetical protein H0E87_004986 [Populus deltoides]|uniref:Uncharacterized protein n=1 Tax=Populus deltoides TaxID=3696 RepID=A0A8T2ZHT6_POPDE|nr:hypothetical protein H0E87_004986 [Populus deltoides]